MRLYYLIGIFLLMTACQQPMAPLPPGDYLTIQGPAGSATLAKECLNDTYKFENANYVIIGKVAEVRSETLPGGKTVAQNVIEVQRVLKGNLEKDKIILETAGDGTFVEDQAMFTAGEWVRLFLYETEGYIGVFCGFMGVQPIDDLAVGLRCDGNACVIVPPVSPPSGVCLVDEDCACGTDIQTGQCAVGLREDIDTSRQCPDACTGIDGKMRTRCQEGVCRVVHLDTT
jgi:hypothetical protein